MALTGTDRGSGATTTGTTSFTLSPASNCAAGSMAVLCVAADNAGSSGLAMTTFSVSDTLGNTWTRRTSPLYDPGSASAGVEGGIFTTPQNGGALTTGTTITVSFGSTSVGAKAWTLIEVSSTKGGAVYLTGANNAGAAYTTGTCTVTTSSITSGDMVIAGVFAENTSSSADPWVGDADTSNGSWSTMQHNGVTASTSGMSTGSQYKVTTGTATQIFNPTASAGAPDCILSWISVREMYTMPVTVGAFSEAANDAIFTANYPMLADTVAFVETGNAAAFTANYPFLASTVDFAETGNAAVLTANYPFIADTVNFVLSGTDTLMSTAIGDLDTEVVAFDLTVSAADLVYIYSVGILPGTGFLTGNVALESLVPGGGLVNDEKPSITLTAESATFALSGNAAGLAAQHSISADFVVFTLSSNDAIFNAGHILTADSVVFTETGNAAGLIDKHVLIADTAAFALSGSDAGLSYGALTVNINGVGLLPGAGFLTQMTAGEALAPGASFVNDEISAIFLPVANGAFVLTGNSVNLVFGVPTLTADTVAFTLTGNDAAFTWTPTGLTVNGVALVAGAGFLSEMVAGEGLLPSFGFFNDELIPANTGMVADHTSFTWTGIAAGLYPPPLPYVSGAIGAEAIGTAPIGSVEVGDGTVTGYVFSVDVGAFVLTRPDGEFISGQLFPADTASFTWTGNDADLSQGTPGTLVANTGTFALTGNDTGFAAAHNLVANSYDVLLSGNTAALTAAHVLTADTSAFALTGNTTGLAYTYPLSTTTGVFSETGNAANFLRTYVFPADSVGFTETANDAPLTHDRPFSAATTSFTLSGQDTLLTYRQGIAADTTGFTLTGHDADLQLIVPHLDFFTASAAFVITPHHNRLQKRSSELAFLSWINTRNGFPDPTLPRNPEGTNWG